MGVRLVLAALAVAFVAGAGSARADNPVLTGDVGLNDAGICFRFEEWPFWTPDQQAAAATGAV